MDRITEPPKSFVDLVADIRRRHPGAGFAELRRHLGERLCRDVIEQGADLPTIERICFDLGWALCELLSREQMERRATRGFGDSMRDALVQWRAGVPVPAPPALDDPNLDRPSRLRVALGVIATVATSIEQAQIVARNAIGIDEKAGGRIRSEDRAARLRRLASTDLGAIDHADLIAGLPDLRADIERLQRLVHLGEVLERANIEHLERLGREAP